MKITPPDFYLVPRQLADDPNITHLDERVYAIIYWFQYLRLGKCTAGNPVIAELAKTTERVVGNSLTRLERFGYIERLYKDGSKRSRNEIRALIAFGKVSSGSEPLSSGSDTEVSSGSEQKKNKIKKENIRGTRARGALTPQTRCRRFFYQPTTARDLDCSVV